LRAVERHADGVKPRPEEGLHHFRAAGVGVELSGRARSRADETEVSRATRLGSRVPPHNLGRTRPRLLRFLEVGHHEGREFLALGGHFKRFIGGGARPWAGTRDTHATRVARDRGGHGGFPTAMEVVAGAGQPSRKRIGSSGSTPVVRPELGEVLVAVLGHPVESSRSQSCEVRSTRKAGT
jgi:hypothetical protein